MNSLRGKTASMSGEVDGRKERSKKDLGIQDRQRCERKKWARLVEKHPCHVKRSFRPLRGI